MSKAKVRNNLKTRRQVIEGGQIFDPIFDQHLDEGEVGADYEDTPINEAASPCKELIFLVPGINSDARWAIEFRIELECWPNAEVEARWAVGEIRQQEIARLRLGKLAKGNKQIGIFDLIRGKRLPRYRYDLRKSIVDCALRHPNHRLHFVCHSMGSAMVANLLRGVDKALSNCGQINRIDNVVFLGSICRSDQGERMRPFVKKYLINDVGTRDVLPMLATFLWPSRYGTVGCYGFCTTYVDDRFWPLNHSTCVGINHLKEKVMPLIDGIRVKEAGPPKPLVSPWIFDLIMRCRNSAVSLVTTLSRARRKAKKRG